MRKTFLTVTVLTLLAPVARAELAPATVSLVAFGDQSSYFGHPEWNLSETVHDISSAAASLSIDVTAVKDETEYQFLSEASADSAGGIAHAEATGHAKLLQGGFGIGQFHGRPYSVATVGYRMEIHSSAPPPIGYHPPIFVLVGISGQAKAQSSYGGTAGAGFQVDIRGGDTNYTNVKGVIASDLFGYNSLDTLDVSVGVKLSMEDPYLSISKQASGYAEAPASYTSQSFYEAVVDPSITFDQARFDAYAATEGFATFNLADYYSMEFSPGIAIPEPACTGVLLLGAGTLCTRRRRSVAA